MRTWWAAACAALALGLAGLSCPMPALAAQVTDACGDTTEGSQDLTDVKLVYSASSFQIRSTLCAASSQYSPNGYWQLVVHLSSFTPEVQISGVMADYGKYAAFSGLRVCAQASCPVQTDSNGFVHASGTPIEGDEFFASLDEPALSGRTAFGYGAWAAVLPAGVSVPEAIDFWAEVRRLTYDGTSAQVDRAPDVGTVNVPRNPAPVATVVGATTGPALTWQQFGGTFRTDIGTLTLADGSPLPHRYVTVQPTYDGSQRSASDSAGRWSRRYWVRRNTTVTAQFPGDGVHDPAASAPYLAGVKAFVSLNLPQSTSVRRGGALLLQGVVRPAHQTGQVRVLVREDRPGTTYRLLRYTNLAQATGDSYYRIQWTPAVRGRYVLRTLWTGGSTAPGAVQSNISDYRRVAVT